MRNVRIYERREMSDRSFVCTKKLLFGVSVLRGCGAAWVGNFDQFSSQRSALEKSGNYHPVTRRRIPEDWITEIRRCESLESCQLFIVLLQKKNNVGNICFRIRIRITDLQKQVEIYHLRGQGQLMVERSLLPAWADCLTDWHLLLLCCTQFCGKCADMLKLFRLN